MIALSTLWLMQGGECFYCGRSTFLSCVSWPQQSFAAGRRRDRRATHEHLLRRCDGGGDEPANLVMACVGCNSRRGGRPVLLHFSEMRKEAAP